MPTSGGLYFWTHRLSDPEYRNFLAWLVGCRSSCVHFLFPMIYVGRQFVPRECLGRLIPGLGVLRDFLRCSLASRHRFHRHCLRKVWAVLRNPHILRYLLRLFHHCFRSTANSQCHPQRRSGLGYDNRSTYRSSVSAQHCAIHFWRLGQFDWMAIWICLYS